MSTVLDLLRLVRHLDADRRWLLLVALAFAASGLFHVAVWAIDGGAWAGDVSWRKPIVFGLSGAITTASLAWAAGAVAPGPGRTRDVRIYLVAMTLEIALITMQRWRGVASHFNTTTIFDAVVFQAMGMLILVASYPIARWAVVVTRDRTLAPERRAAVAGGLWLLLAGVVVGMAMAGLGSTAHQMNDATMIATARALVPAHALGLHGIQMMMVLAVVLPHVVRDGSQRIRILRGSALAAFGMLLALAILGVLA